MSNPTLFCWFILCNQAPDAARCQQFLSNGMRMARFSLFCKHLPGESCGIAFLWKIDVKSPKNHSETQFWSESGGHVGRGSRFQDAPRNYRAIHEEMLAPGKARPTPLRRGAPTAMANRSAGGGI